MENVRNLAELLEVLRKQHNTDLQKENTSGKKNKNEKDPKSFSISIAGRTVAINSQYSEVYLLCKEYESTHEPELHIDVSDEDIVTERNHSQDGRSSYTNSYLETLAVLRKISEEMLAHDTFLMHGAVVAVNNKAYMFTAKSGTGKTTHINKWLDNLDNAYVVNGDKPLIRITENEAIACGTPWCGKEQMGTNTMVPLKAIVFLERAEENSIEEISYNQAFVPLIQQIYEPADAEKMKKSLSLLSKLNTRVQFFRYKCNNMKSDAFSVTYKALVRE